MIKEGNNNLMGNREIGEIGYRGNKGIRDYSFDFTMDEAGRIDCCEPDESAEGMTVKLGR